jgi:hypothetical protein
MAIKTLSLPTQKAVFDMLATDTLQITFTEAGLFCSKDSDDFSPNLPNDVTFNIGDVWPNQQQYPSGASPAGDDDAKYHFKTEVNAKCGDPAAGTAGGTIHVGTGTC